MKDKFNREINYLRISLTDKCDLRCCYCMSEKGIEKKSHDEILSEEELLDVVNEAVKLGINKVRLTGGEPLVKKNILSIIEKISRINGINDLSLTTNGTRLKEMAFDLKKAGLNRINISLDTLNKDKYKYITRCGDINNVLDGLKKAKEVGFDKIKINVVLIKGFNDDEIKDFINLTVDEDIDVRFIELMPMINDEINKSYVSNQIVLEKVNLDYLGTQGVAEMYKLSNGKGKVGLISAISNSFCNKCNKIRLTADGKLKPCLHSNIEIPIKGVEDKKEALIQAIKDKPEEHKDLLHKLSEANREMNKIGG